MVVLDTTPHPPALFAPVQNLMVGKGDHLRITDYGLAGDCHKLEVDPWTGKEHKDLWGDGALICAPLTGGTQRYMSEELVQLQRELATCGPEAREKYTRIKEEKQVTAATTDLVAAALVAVELYMQWNAWPLLGGLGIDGAAVRAALDLFAAKPSLAEVEAWGAAELAAWLGRTKKLEPLQQMAIDNGVGGRAVLDAAVTGDVASLFSNVRTVVKATLRKTVRAELPTLAMPPPLFDAVACSLKADVAERPRDATTMPRGFSDWCKAANSTGNIQVCMRSKA